MKYAFLSVSNKSGIASLARELLKHDIQLIASDGTAAFLKKQNIAVISMSDYLDMEPILDGRVKTLHPKLYASILAIREKPAHLHELARLNLHAIDFVIVDLYPFTDHTDNETDAIEHIDIGGISLIRAAAKNYQSCTIICNQADYAAFEHELSLTHGETTLAFRKKMATRAFQTSSAYDANISQWFSGDSKTELVLTQTLPLSYGENPHQKAGFYNLQGDVPNIIQHQGNPISYNNIMDIDAGINLVRAFQKITATVIKHTNPCGVAISETSVDAIQKAFNADLKSAFGGIVVLNHTIDGPSATYLTEHFIEVIAAPNFTDEALCIFKRKPKLRVVTFSIQPHKQPDMKTALNGFLIQNANPDALDPNTFSTPTTKKALPHQIDDLVFAFQVVKHVKSNAIVIAKDGVTCAIGAGQTNRVDAVALALKKIQGFDLSDAVLASDGFFPFADSIEIIHQAHINTIIQPGGSIRDADVIQACEKFGMCMVFTAMRGFWH